MQFELDKLSNNSDGVIDMRWPNKEIKVTEIDLDGHLIHMVLFTEDDCAFGKVDPDVDDISREELEALNRPKSTTFGCEL